MAEPFDEYERELGTGLELLKFFRERKQEISFSTKSDWFVDDPRYMELISGAEHFNFKVSIITPDESLAAKVEPLVPPPQARLNTIAKLSKAGVGGVTLRLRPFIIGISSPRHTELIEMAADAGATAVSTEFLCIERRASKAYKKFQAIGDLAGYDLIDFYVKNSKGQSGYLRLNRNVKRPFILEMAETCQKRGLRFYVSDAHFKEFSCNGSCCGLAERFNYSRGQFTEALVLARKNGSVKWSDIEKNLDYADTFLWGFADGFNQATSEQRGRFHDFTMKDWMRFHWNNVNGAKSPYKYFGGALYPIGKDDNENVIYEYRGEYEPEI